MKKILFCLLLTAAIAKSVSAQDENDAIRYGFTNYQGAARGSSIGGALGSVGGDFGSLSVNPAGLGIYRKSEIAFTPSFSVIKNETNYLGSANNESQSKLTFSHFGIVLTNSKTGNRYKNSNWKSTSFAFGMNRLANFKNDYTYSGNNSQSSIVEKWAEDFNKLGGINDFSKNNVNFPAFAAYQTYLIDKDYIGGDTTKAKSYVPYSSGIKQTKSVSETGGINEYVLSMGGNYQEHLMLGATLGINSVNYTRFQTFDEVDVSGNENNDFKYMRFYENLKTTGTGLNLKLGAIYKLNKNFRAGIALHTPTQYWLTDISDIGMESHTDSFLIRNNISNSPIVKYTQDSSLTFDYSQTSPYKAILSATYLFDKYGFITGDLEYVDYATMKYNFGSGYKNETKSMNNTLSATYKSAVNVRLGAEAKLGDFSLRAGYAMYGSPSASIETRSIVSGGIGYRTDSWFLDATLMHSNQKSMDTPYVLGRSNANVQNASLVQNRTNAIVTLGFKF